ncbi:unnamed protein product, partial [marine sediment metagenome]
NEVNDLAFSWLKNKWPKKALEKVFSLTDETTWTEKIDINKEK